MIEFIIGLIIGEIFGVIVMALVVGGSENDD